MFVNICDRVDEDALHLSVLYHIYHADAPILVITAASEPRVNKGTARLPDLRFTHTYRKCFSTVFLPWMYVTCNSIKTGQRSNPVIRTSCETNRNKADRPVYEVYPTSPASNDSYRRHNPRSPPHFPTRSTQCASPRPSSGCSFLLHCFLRADSSIF